MRQIISILALLMLLCVASCDEDLSDDPEIMAVPFYTDSTVIWRGFRHKWHYNHRWNRFGDYIHVIDHSSTHCSADLVHAAASGIGSDDATYTSYYYAIAAEDVWFQTGQKEVTLTGSEDVGIQQTIAVRETADENMRNRYTYRTFLNGFDLCSIKDSKKPIGFLIQMSDATYSQDNGKIAFDINVRFNLGCSTDDCISNKLKYTLRINYVIMANEHKGAPVTYDDFHLRYSWDTDDDIDIGPERHSIKGNGSGNYHAAALAFRELEMSLDDEHWMLEWQSIIDPKDYDSSSGTHEFDLYLLFKQWADGMKDSHPPESWAAKKREGSATFRANIALIQFTNASIEEGKHKSTISWKAQADGGGGCSEDSRVNEFVEFDFQSPLALP